MRKLCGGLVLLAVAFAPVGCKPQDQAGGAPRAAASDPGPPNPPKPPEGGLPKVYLVLVADTRGQAAVSGFTLDVERNAAAVRHVLTGGLGTQRLAVTELRGEQVRAADIVAAIRGLPASPADAIVCYVAGVGASTPVADDGFTFSLYGGAQPEPLPRAELRGWLTDKHPRLAVLLSETSNGVPKTAPGLLQSGGSANIANIPADIPPGPAASPSDPASMAPGLQALFLNSPGVVDLSGADDKQSGWGPAGETAFFTRAVCRGLLAARDNPAANWTALYSRAKVDTQAGYREWWAAEFARINAKPQPPPPPEQAVIRGLIGQPTLTSKAYYLAGGRLKVLVQGTDGAGVKVIDLPLDSPTRAAGVRLGDVIVRAQGVETPTTEAWDKAVSAALQGGAKTLTFRVRTENGPERDVFVPLGD